MSLLDTMMSSIVGVSHCAQLLAIQHCCWPTTFGRALDSVVPLLPGELVSGWKLCPDGCSFSMGTANLANLGKV